MNTLHFSADTIRTNTLLRCRCNTIVAQSKQHSAHQRTLQFYNLIHTAIEMTAPYYQKGKCSRCQCLCTFEIPRD